jgi:hypothetical protein
MKVRTRKEPEPIIRAAEGGNPRAAPFKQLEMSIKRAYQLNSGLIDCLAMAGDVTTLKRDRLWMIISSKDLKLALKYGDYGKEDAAVHSQDAWEWMIDHWYTGALRRSVIATMSNLTNENKKAIKTKVSELYE